MVRGRTFEMAMSCAICGAQIGIYSLGQQEMTFILYSHSVLMALIRAENVLGRMLEAFKAYT